MKMEHELKEVMIIRHRTVSEALNSMRSPMIIASHTVSSRMINSLTSKKLSDSEAELVTMLQEPLVSEYEDAAAYTRTCALVSLSEEMGQRVFYTRLAREMGDWYPASLSEGASYLSALRSKAEVGTVIHLGTILHNEDYEERRILTGEHRNGIIPFYPATQLKPCWKIVVIKK